MADSLVSQVRVTIGGLEYQIACAPAERQRLERLAAEFDKRVGALKERAGEIGDRRILVMAGLSLLDQLEAERERTDHLKKSVTALERAREAAALASEADDERMVERIEEAAAAVEEAARLLNRDTLAILTARGLPTAGKGISAHPAADTSPDGAASVGDLDIVPRKVGHSRDTEGTDDV